MLIEEGIEDIPSNATGEFVNTYFARLSPDIWMLVSKKSARDKALIATGFDIFNGPLFIPCIVVSNTVIPAKSRRADGLFDGNDLDRLSRRRTGQRLVLSKSLYVSSHSLTN